MWTARGPETLKSRIWVYMWNSQSSVYVFLWIRIKLNKNQTLQFFTFLFRLTEMERNTDSNQTVNVLIYNSYQLIWLCWFSTGDDVIRARGGASLRTGWRRVRLRCRSFLPEGVASTSRLRLWSPWTAWGPETPPGGGLPLWGGGVSVAKHHTAETLVQNVRLPWGRWGYRAASLRPVGPSCSLGGPCGSPDRGPCIPEGWSWSWGCRDCSSPVEGSTSLELRWVHSSSESLLTWKPHSESC